MLLPELQIERIFPGNTVVTVMGRYNTTLPVVLFFLPSLSVYSVYSWNSSSSLSPEAMASLQVVEYSPGQISLLAGQQYPQGLWMDAQKAKILLGSSFDSNSILNDGISLVYYGVDGKPLNSVGMGALFFMQPAKKSKLVWFIILGVIALAAIVFGVVYFRGRAMYAGASGMYQSDVLISQVEAENGHLDSDLRRSGGELLRDVGEPEGRAGRKGAKSFGEA